MTYERKTILPKSRGVIKKHEYKYVITDQAFGKFYAKNSANAFWLDRGKLDRLITAFKYGSTIKEACILAGISSDQWKYFIKIHPEFSTIKEALVAIPVLRARKKVMESIEKDVTTARWYLERKKPEEFGKNTKNYFDALNDIDMREKIEETRRQFR